MKVVLNKKAQKQFEKLDSVAKKRIAELFDELELSSNPRSKGKALAGGLSGLGDTAWETIAWCVI